MMPGNWIEANQQYLIAALASVRAVLEQYTAGLPCLSAASLQTAWDAAGAGMPAPAAFERLSAIFGLSPFERSLVLLCAGMELDSTFAAQCAAAHGAAQRPYPTFSLALAALPQAHWSALAPSAPLRYWRLIEVGAGETLALSPLRLDEGILHYLTGVASLDERLQGLVTPLAVPALLPPSQAALAQRIVALWSQPGVSDTSPVIQLAGPALASKQAIAASACASLGLHLYTLQAADVPTLAAERLALARLWERQALLTGSALLVDGDAAEGETPWHPVRAFMASQQGWLFLSSREPVALRQRASVHLPVARPLPAEQQALWSQALEDEAPRLQARVATLVAQFPLEADTIASACALARSDADPEVDDLGARLWTICRSQARPELDDLAQRLEPHATWDDLVLPAPQCATLQTIVAHVRHRFTVYHCWGFEHKSPRGLGISALFTGPSGTGKTLAAEVLAQALNVDLYRIDLSQVVSKYIGETEKNLRRIFDAAETGGAILLFDEADALFGKRSDVKDSHDRYANIEVSYLLQRMEAYRGLAILTTNLPNALDTAFTRRLRFIVPFPFPDQAQRAHIWRRSFPAATPTKDLDMDQLARLNVVGGTIRNIALNAAFLAAAAQESVGMQHVLQAAQGEYLKLEKPLSEAEVGGWI